MRYLRAGCLIITLWLSASALAKPPLSFGVIRDAYPPKEKEILLLRALLQTDKESMSFVLVNGIKGAHEPCSDQLYNDRLSVFNLSRHPLILSLTGNDWISCTGADMHESIANERLQRIRDLFFEGNMSLGQSSLRVIQESNNPEFRSYSENMQWESHQILFATLNVPAPNNHFVMRGGHNSEFEDRQVANTEWIKRLFIIAKAQKAQGIVIFTDADIFTLPSHRLFSLKETPDGFSHIRNTITTLSDQFTGHVLLISNQSSAKKNNTSHIVWRKRLGHINTNATWLKITADDKSKTLFMIKKEQLISSPELPSSSNKKAKSASR